MEPEETIVPGQRFLKHVPAQMNTHATIEDLLDAVHVVINTQHVMTRKWSINFPRMIVI
jgi:hypothetical protein